MYCTNCGAPIGDAAPQDVKKLTRPSNGKWVAGVCAGFANYFGVDVTLVRLAWLVSVILAGTGILAYILCWIVIPKEYSA